MRRAQGYSYQPLSQAPNRPKDDHVENENQRLTEELQAKIGVLNSLAIDIGHEVRYQDKLLRGIDDDMDRTGGFLSNTMNRVTRLGRNGHQKFMLYIFLFALFVFLLLYFVIKLR
ncbi:BET1 homolog [Contarinia nasturtii]|uniref:BET1 homolog n=1 Tax=Contarinia nasturtii TaxID=265458 RepID=UPI0012D3D2CA|nr:BET1 homolog [Contarinia nasturtii]XP_031624409.1 BET1 homolog [Contarinia nasturtii]